MGVSANTQSWSMNVDSEDNSDDSSDGQCSSPLQSSDEDFGVDEAEMHTVYSSYEKEGKSKGKTSNKKINERVLDEDIQSRAENEDEIQSSDEYDEDYLHFLKCLYSSNSNQGENAEVFGSSVNAGKSKRGRPQKNRSPGFEYEAEDRAMSENYDCSKKGSVIQSSDSLPYDLNSKSGATKKRSRPLKNTSEAIGSEKDPIGEIAKSEFEDIENGDEQFLEWLRDLELSGRCEKGGNSKRGRPQEGMNVGVGSEPKKDDHQQRGRLPKDWNKQGFDSERGCRRSRRIATKHI